MPHESVTVIPPLRGSVRYAAAGLQSAGTGLHMFSGLAISFGGAVYVPASVRGVFLCPAILRVSSGAMGRAGKLYLLSLLIQNRLCSKGFPGLKTAREAFWQFSYCSSIRTIKSLPVDRLTPGGDPGIATFLVSNLVKTTGLAGGFDSCGFLFPGGQIPCAVDKQDQDGSCIRQRFYQLS